MSDSEVKYNGVQIPEGEMLYAMRHTCVAFLSFYIGDELDMEVPGFHLEIWQELLDMLDTMNQAGTHFVLKKLFAVPRDHAKSTLAKLAVILLLKYSSLSFVLYVSKTNAIAKNAIRDILWWLESRQERELFGPMRKEKSSEGESLWIITMGTRTYGRDEVVRKRCIFRALGADQQIRGTLIMNRRPQIIIIDDIEDLDNTTPQLQGKLDEWFMGSLMKSFNSRQHVVIFIGNMIRKTTLLARLSQNPTWNPTVFGALVKDKHTGELRALWDGKYTVQGLLDEYAEYRRMGTGHIWEAEMMNLGQDVILACDFSKVVRVPTPVVEELECGFICLDPAFGTKAYNDESAITVHAQVKDVGVPVIIDSAKGRWTDDRLFDEMLEMSYRWGVKTWCIESVAAQKLLLSVFRLLMSTRKIPEGMFDLLPIAAGHSSKSSRILSMRSAIAGGSYGVASSQTELLDHFGAYTPDSNEHDDLCDSAAYGPIAWDMYGDNVRFNGISHHLEFEMINGVGSLGHFENESEAMVADC